MRKTLFKYVYISVSIILFIISIVSTASIITAEDNFVGLSEVDRIDWGGIENGWKDIFYLKNIRMFEGPRGKLGLELTDNQPEFDDNTDLLLHFDSIRYRNVKIEGFNYRLRFSDIFPSIDTKEYGEGAGAFRTMGNRVEVIPEESAVLFPGSRLKSFTIDFYLYPTMIFNESTILSFRSPSIFEEGKYSGFRVYFDRGRLKWEFEGLFTDRNGKIENFSIAELESTPLYEWHRHTMYYDSSSGMLVLYVDGRESAIKWLTESGREGGTLLIGKIPETNVGPLVLGGSFLGFIDEFRIYRGKLNLGDGKYKNYGVALSKVIHFKTKNAKIAAIDWKSREVKGTAVRIYYRYSKDYFLPYEDSGKEKRDDVKRDGDLGTTYSSNGIKLRNEPEWKIAKRGEKIGINASYFQWKAEFYGTENTYTPILDRLTVYYIPDRPPARPILLDAVPGNGSVHLKWVSNKEYDIVGYKIYYGTESKMYFGRGADIGDSPVLVKNINEITLKNLKNEQVYFFAITTVDRSGQESDFSRELATRPSLLYAK